MFIYRFISNIFLLLSPLIIIFRIVKGKEDPLRFKERYGYSSLKRRKGKLIWFHCCSVGELLSIIPLIEKLEKEKKINQILVTTITTSAEKIIRSFSFKKTIHQYFPIDNDYIIKRFLNFWDPHILFLCESEIWPNLIYRVSEKNTKLILLNARLTNKSFKKWKYVNNFSQKIFKKFNICLTQNKETKKYLKNLGSKNIKSLGNLKFTFRKKFNTEKLDIKKTNFFKKKKILLTAASTHDDEENFVLKSHLYFSKQKKIKNLVSIIIPRHINRVNEINESAAKFGFKTHLHSSKNKISNDTNIYLVDSYGEVNKFYRLSSTIFMGGSIIPHGGQNPLEAARFGCKIIHGPYISNFKEIYKKLKSMNISSKFNSYNNGIKIIEKKFNKKNNSFNNILLIKYGEKVLNSNYSEIIKLILK